ncbi:MAG: 4'-phosphopantetheinyl transferase superfamily protein [Bacteroidota bacterium]|nr:4'-phosphopantetheinyl transferase superfamily protein [Bacteroidota bacterium]
MIKNRRKNIATFITRMPLTQIKEIKPGILLGRWTITETLEQLKSYPRLPEGLQIPEYITHEKRMMEWLATRILAYETLQRFTSENYSLLNSKTGKPYFTDCPYQISISHTQQQVVVLISENTPVGIDIERIQSKVSRIQDKFLNPEEKSAIGNDLAKLTIAWSAKESLYKLYGKKNIIFNENLLLSPFQLTLKGEIEAYVHTSELQKKIIVFFEVEPETVLTYCFDN